MFDVVLHPGPPTFFGRAVLVWMVSDDLNPIICKPLCKRTNSRTKITFVGIAYKN